MCSNSYLNHYIKVGQLPKCMVSYIESTGQLLMKRVVSSSDICTWEQAVQLLRLWKRSHLPQLVQYVCRYAYGFRPFRRAVSVML